MTSSLDEVLRWAASARLRRDEVVEGVASGALTLAGVLAQGQDDLVSPIKLVVVVQAVPGVGKVAARRVLAELGLSSSRVGDLGPADAEALQRRLGAIPPASGGDGRTAPPPPRR